MAKVVREEHERADLRSAIIAREVSNGHAGWRRGDHKTAAADVWDFMPLVERPAQPGMAWQDAEAAFKAMAVMMGGSGDAAAADAEV